MARKKTAQRAPAAEKRTQVTNGGAQAAPGESERPNRLNGRFWAAAAARQAQPVTASFRNYSRFVGRAKLILPISAAALLVAVVAWPYFSLGFSKLRTPLAVPSLAQIDEVRMLAPHYIGTDRQQRPFSITAKLARQTGDNGDLMALDGPQAEIKTDHGAPVTVTGDSGIYQSQAHFLDLSGHVTLAEQAKGYSFHTDRARVDLQNGTTEGHDTVTGEGPSGHVQAEGFRAERDGDSITFLGHTDLTINAAGQKS